MIKLDKMRSVRKALGRSQSQMAAMLGISTRAVQSYEQGWRPTPDHVQKLAGMLVFLQWQKTHRRQRPCWELMACKGPRRESCYVYQCRAGDFCWLVTRSCEQRQSRPWKVKLNHCSRCKVMQRWLGR